jgi:hypothetical protein
MSPARAVPGDALRALLGVDAGPGLARVLDPLFGIDDAHECVQRVRLGDGSCAGRQRRVGLRDAHVGQRLPGEQRRIERAQVGSHRREQDQQLAQRRARRAASRERERGEQRRRRHLSEEEAARRERDFRALLPMELPGSIGNALRAARPIARACDAQEHAIVQQRSRVGRSRVGLASVRLHRRVGLLLDARIGSLLRREGGPPAGCSKNAKEECCAHGAT